jgi:hypothetical protein
LVIQPLAKTSCPLLDATTSAVNAMATYLELRDLGHQSERSCQCCF